MTALANVSLSDTFSTWLIRTNQLVVKTNDSELALISAFDKANSANYYTHLIDANTSSAFNKANSANLLAYNVGINTNNYLISVIAGANTDVGAGANAYAVSVGAGANNFLIATLNGANSAVGAGANAYAASVGVITISAFTKANAALPNTSGVTFEGNLKITGSVNVRSGIISSSNNNIGSAGQALFSNGSGTYWAPISQFDSGTAMLFAQTSAPTGWTKSTTHNDKALRVVSGAASNGGSVAFSTAFASQSVSGTVGSTTISTTTMPSHNHTFSSGIQTCSAPPFSGIRVDTLIDVSSPTTTSTSGSGGSHNHTFSGTAINLAVNYVDAIIATKD